MREYWCQRNQVFLEEKGEVLFKVGRGFKSPSPSKRPRTSVRGGTGEARRREE